MRYPRYTTYGDQELAETIDKIGPLKRTGVTAWQLRTGKTGEQRGGLIKIHDCAVLFPDGMTGTCHYVRGGPNWHTFQYRHPGRAKDSIRPILECSLRVVNYTKRMENTPTAISLKAQEMAGEAYASSILSEQRDHFVRATAPPGYKPGLSKPAFSAKRAKEIGGKYTLCIKLGDSLVPKESELFDKMEAANAAWREKGDPKLFVACACRFSRQWEMPRFNPLYGDFSGKEVAPDVESDEENK